MKPFRKNKDTAQGPAAGRPSGRGAKRTLGSVLDETTWPMAADLIYQKSPDAMAGVRLVDGQDHRWGIVAVLNTEDEAVGGFTSRKAHNEEARGSFLALVRARAIDVLATQQMLEDNQFALILSPETMDRVAEYHFLVKPEVQYTLEWVNLDDESAERIELCTTDFSGLEALAGPKDNDLSDESNMDLLRVMIPADKLDLLQDVTGEEDGPVAPVVTAAVPVVEKPETSVAPKPSDPGTVSAVAVDEYGEPMVDVDELNAEAFDMEDEGVTPSYEDEIGENGDYDPVGLPEGWEGLEESSDEDEDDEDAEPIVSAAEVLKARQAETVQIVEYTQAQVDQSLERRVLRDKLELVMSMAPFEQNFPMIEPVLFEVDEDAPEGEWYQTQITALRREVNARILQLQADQQEALRSEYAASLEKIIDTVSDKLSLTEGPAADELRRFEAEFEASKKKARSEIEAERERLERAYNARRKAHADQAFTAAEASFDHTHRARHQIEVTEVEQKYLGSLEADFVAERQTFLDERQSLAHVTVDAQISQVLDQLRVTREGQLRDMEDLHESLTEMFEQERARMIMAQEAANTQLRRQLDESSRVADTTKSFQDQIESIKAENAGHVAALREQIEQLTNKAQQQELARQEELSQTIQTLSAERDAARAERDEAYGERQDALARRQHALEEVQSTEATMQARLKAQEDQMQAMRAAHVDERRRQSYMVIALMVGLFIIAVILGWMLNMAFGR